MRTDIAINILYNLPFQLTEALENDDDQTVEMILPMLEESAPVVRNVLQYLEDQATALKHRAQAFQSAADTAQRKHDRIKEAVKAALLESGNMEIKPFKVYQHSQTVDESISNPYPAAFTDIIETKKVRKKDIIAALKAGETVEGWELRPVYAMKVGAL